MLKRFLGLFLLLFVFLPVFTMDKGHEVEEQPLPVVQEDLNPVTRVSCEIDVPHGNSSHDSSQSSIISD